jgi:hypothetical protein
LKAGTVIKENDKDRTTSQVKTGIKSIYLRTKKPVSKRQGNLNE